MRPIAFFNGWGMDERAIAHLDDGRQVLLLAPLAPVPTLPRDALIVAWSMGVWAAARFLAQQPHFPALALNGTPRGIGEAIGIPPAQWQATQRHFSEANRGKLWRRMLSHPTWRRDDFSPWVPARSLESQAQELQALWALREQWTPAPFTAAWGSDDDRVFPIAAQRAYWGSKLVCFATTPHHLLRRFNSWAEVLSFLDGQ